MINTQLQRNLNLNLSRMAKLQEQLSTGRLINRPSDDPVGITYSLRYRSELAANEQYRKNVDAALSWLNFTDTMIGQAGDVIHRIQELTVQGSTGTNPDVAMDNVASEILQLRDQLVNIGNSQLAGKYVFNGEQYDIAPYSEQNENPNPDPNVTDYANVVTDTGQVRYEVGPGVVLAINVTGNELFGSPTDNDNLFRVIDRIVTALQNGDKDAASDELANLESRLEKILVVRAEVGAKTNRVELMENRLKDLELNATDLLSRTEDADMAELLMRSKIEENIYNASLAVGAKIIVPSLVDFLR
jgi:flagellar hook-associated protein 3 FlgL